MSINREDKKATAALKIESSMTIYETANLRDEWLECLNTQDGLSLDFGDVEDCDAAGVQLLCSAIKTAIQEEKSFCIIGASPSVFEALNRAGLKPNGILSPKSQPADR